VRSLGALKRLIAMDDDNLNPEPHGESLTDVTQSTNMITTAIDSHRADTRTMGREIKLIEIIDLEKKAEETGSVADAIQVWSVKFYHQRPFWYDIFVSFTDIYNILFCQWFMTTLAAPSYTDEYFTLRWHLRDYAGIQPIEEIIYDLRPRTPLTLLRGALRTETFRAAVHGLSPRPGTSQDTGHFIARPGTPDSLLTPNDRQSKLSAEQLSELQRSTHFDKKELQQWYKGKFHQNLNHHNLCEPF
jgi:hypothetical protein